jgi:hypothetical protein
MKIGTKTMIIPAIHVMAPETVTCFKRPLEAIEIDMPGLEELRKEESRRIIGLRVKNRSQDVLNNHTTLTFDNM